MTAAKYYIWRSGDSLSSVSIKLYNDASKWRSLADLNKIRDPRKIADGTRIRY